MAARGGSGPSGIPRPCPDEGWSVGPHAWRLAFTHPVTGETMQFSSPLPEDMAGLCGFLRDRATAAGWTSPPPNPLPAGRGTYLKSFARAERQSHVPFRAEGDHRISRSRELSALEFRDPRLLHAAWGGEPGAILQPQPGILAGDRVEDVRRNQTLVEEAFAIPDGRLILMRQVHGDRIRVLDGDGPLPGGLPNATA